MGITALVVANLLTLTVVVLVWSALPNMRAERAASTRSAKPGTGELRRGKTGSLAAS
jgi:hypothetical protein